MNKFRLFTRKKFVKKAKFEKVVKVLEREKKTLVLDYSVF